MQKLIALFSFIQQRTAISTTYLRTKPQAFTLQRGIASYSIISLIFLLLMTSQTYATNPPIVVTFYTDRASFLAAISPYATHDFEGITSDTGIQNFGTSYHTGSVTFTSPISLTQSNLPRELSVKGKNAQALGKPFDSAILPPLLPAAGNI